MNSFTKGLLTGVFGVVVGLLISGSNYQEGQDLGKWEKYRVGSDAIGTYQISTTTNADGFYIRETIIDTRIGEVVSRQSIGKSVYKKIED